MYPLRDRGYFSPRERRNVRITPSEKPNTQTKPQPMSSKVPTPFSFRLHTADANESSLKTVVSECASLRFFAGIDFAF
jgi:hypothetical protein